MPSRLLPAFPPGVSVSRVPLDQAIARVGQRLAVPSSSVGREEEPRSREGAEG
jgi:ATP-dependent DNA helicase DinG